MPAAAHVFVGDVEAPVLDAADRHHLGRVLRLRAGEEVTVADGAGAYRAYRLGPGMTLEPAGPPRRSPAPSPPLAVAFALTKGERPEWVVQKLTEVGVDRIVPVVSARSVVRWDADRAEGHLARLRQVARGAAMQSRRTWLPTVEGLHTFGQAVELLGPDGLALAHPGGEPPAGHHRAVLVGPEGGWDRSELASPLARVGLGPTVLRAETAAMAAGLLMCALRAGLVRPCPLKDAQEGGSNTLGGNGG